MQAQNSLEEVDLGYGTTKRLTYISVKLDPSLKTQVIMVLKEFKDCFVWDYNEMHGLIRELVELKLPIRPNKRPLKTTLRSFVPEFVSKIKADIERMLKKKFIRTLKYVKWLENIILVIKKNDTFRVRIDFRELNVVTLK